MAKKDKKSSTPKGFGSLTTFMGEPKKKEQETNEKETPPEQLPETPKPEPQKENSKKSDREPKIESDFKKEEKKEKKKSEKPVNSERSTENNNISQNPETSKLKPLQKTFFPPDTTLFGDAKYEVELGKESRESIKSLHLRTLQQANQIVQNMAQGILLSLEYDGGANKAFAKFYDLADNSIKIWIDTTGHRPYCLHKSSMGELERNTELLTHAGYEGMDSVEKFDLLHDKSIQMTKIFGTTPTDIGGAGGIRSVLRAPSVEINNDYESSDEEETPEEDPGEGGAWEANIRYHHNFIFDLGLIPGMYYKIENGNITQITPSINVELERKLMEVFSKESPEIQEMAKTYHPVFSSPIPHLKRVAYDIEVEETPNKGLPDPLTAKFKVISVSFASNDGFRAVYCLDRPEISEGAMSEDFPSDAKVFFFKDEKELIKETFRILWRYPIVITFNGDNFDNTYMYHRASRLKLDPKLNPFYLERGGGMMIRQTTDLKQGVHIDVFQFFSNRSIKGYAFGGAYIKNSLEEVASSLLGQGKIKHEGVLIGEMTLADLIYYNMNDSIITLELTTFNEQLAFHLMVILMRITKLPMQDIFRVQISAWIRSLMISEHRRKQYLVPRRSELLQVEEGFSQATIDGKRFQGAYVIDPVPGIHFEVAVLDFSSLYPSIIKTRNLSYETTNCIHPECQKNALPNTPYWGCTKKMGIFAYVVGFLRDVRVKYFKQLSGDKSIPKEDRQTAKVMASALKVFINGAYGVFGSPVFPLFCLRVAESTTAIGRFSIQSTIEKATQMGIKVLYGDSDSVFLLHPTADQVDELIKWSEKKLDLDLELEKTYQFLALSDRKKNYIGVKKGSGEVDIKGLLAKKHNTPEFIKMKFTEVQQILQNILDMDSFTLNRDKIIKIIKDTNRLIGVPPEKGGFNIEAYAINVGLKKKIKDYVKTMPQHVKAAKMLPKEEIDQLEPGDFINYVKTRSKEGVKPVTLATLVDIDHTKYKEMVKSTFEQLLDALGINYEEILGVKKLTSFFG